MTTFTVCFPLAVFGASLLEAFWRANAAGQVIVVIHFFGSMLAWSLMLTKWKELSDAARVSARFGAAYRKEPNPVSLFLKRQRSEGSPTFGVYEGVCRALATMIESHGGNAEDLFAGDAGETKRRLKEREVQSLRTTGEGVMFEQRVRIGAGMGTLAVAVAAAPALGLLGTAWGLMDAFGAAGSAAGGATLAALAPGLSGALLPTVTGLLVGLPSAIAHRMLARRVRSLGIGMETFLRSLMRDIENHYGEPGGTVQAGG